MTAIRRKSPAEPGRVGPRTGVLPGPVPVLIGSTSNRGNLRRSASSKKGAAAYRGSGRHGPALPYCEPSFAADAAAAIPVRDSRTSIATLLASHILHDGETVILLLRPSIWFLLVSAVRFYAAAAVLMTAVAVIGNQTHRPIHALMETGGAVIAARLMWATLQWMGRLYVLTDLRTLTLTGVFTIDVIDCPLRKVAKTRLVQPPYHRILGIGSVVLTPTDEKHPVSWWYLVDHPNEVLKQIDATIHRARQGGGE